MPASSINPKSFSVHWIEFFFITFSGVTIIFQLISLLGLWVVKLTVSQQRKLLVVAQVVNSVTGMDVFIVSIFASVLQIEPFAQNIVLNTGLASLNPFLNEIIPKIPFIADKVDGDYNVFDLQSRLRPGFVVLALACVLSTSISIVVLRKSSIALFDTQHRALAESFAEAAGSAIVSGPAGAQP